MTFHPNLLGFLLVISIKLTKASSLIKWSDTSYHNNLQLKTAQQHILLVPVGLL